MTSPPAPAFADPRVAAVFAAYGEDVRAPLLRLRALILQAAADAGQADLLVETLKWNQPAYLNPKSKVGTTVRIDALPRQAGSYALYVHCQTTLADTFRALYGDVLKVEGDRAVVFRADQPLPEDAVRHCATLALTYHRGGKRTT